MTQNTRARRAHIPGSVRLAALVLTALTLCALLSLRPVRAAEWMTPYLEQVQEWGVMRGDSQGNLHEDRNITRAEFVTLVNRAFGYEEPSPDNPFTDVNPNDWFAEDISIARQAGYFNGTSETTASPYALVTREQAAVLLGRCLRFQGVPNAANSTFTDMRDIGGWSRPLVQEAAELGIIQGYADGSFKPDRPITRGQMACFLVRALGTLVQEPGEQTSGGVYGNLTITTPGVKLKDTVVTGNLYLTGGVGLGNVELENVSVQGKIVICGGGEAEAGKQSVLLRNVTAGALELDSLSEQFLSVQAEGLTNIGEVTVRTPGYLEDRTEDGLGLQTIRLDGIEGSLFQLAGNIKRVVNLTPGSTLQLAQGVADVITMDEKAVEAKLTIDDRASIRELNLDLAAQVDGKGSVSHLNINAPGSKVTMLPDTIYIRPGITGNVFNQTMDNIAAAESSEDPRLLAGYPKVKDIAPTSATAVFSTNKPGTIHWAVTALMDGSLGEEELMNPGSNAKILRSGTLRAAASNTEITARLTGLTREGSYYVSALLVDARGRRSPVKIAAFTTPDDSAPNFANGYPQNPILTVDADNEQVAQVMVMATKDCQMYYALFPRGSTAPTAADFRSAALPGNLGYGIVTLRKNTPFLLSRINTSHLQEQTQYDLYLWLNDADNGKSSAVRRLQFTTKDMTPPTIQDLHVVSYTGTSVTLSFTLDEPGSLSWAAVTKDESIRVNKENPTVNDQIKIENILVDGKTVVRRGGPVRAARGATAYTFTVTGLQGQTTYDLYYMAKDTAGNYCVYNKAIAFPFPIRTQDNQAPTVDKRYSHSELDEDTKIEYAYLDSDISLVFSEEVLGFNRTNTGAEGDPDDFHALYSRVLSTSGDDQVKAKAALASALSNHISLHTGTAPGSGEPPKDSYVTAVTASTTPEQLANMPQWIDYREAVVTREGGKTVITFPAGKGIQLQSGTRYYFYVRQMQDTADPVSNKLTSASVAINTISARVEIKEKEDVEYAEDGRVLTIFRLIPNEAAAFAPASARWDLILWAHEDIEYDLFVRNAGETKWTKLTPDGHPLRALVSGGRVYHSLYGNLSAQMIKSGYFGIGENEGRPHLRDLTEELQFAVLSTEGGQDGDVHMEAELYTGTDSQLRPISRYGQATDAVFSALATPLERISDPKAYKFTVPSELAPKVRLVGTIDPKRDSVSFSVNLTPSGTVYCMAVPITQKTSDALYSLADNTYAPGYYNYSGQTDEALVNLSHIHTGQLGDTGELWVHPKHPETETITKAGRGEIDVHVKIKVVSTGLLSSGSTAPVTIPGLDAGTEYILYLVSEDEFGNPANQALCYRFKTDPPEPPKIWIDPTSTTSATLQVDTDSKDVKYLLARTFQLTGDSDFNKPFRGDMIKDGINLAEIPAKANTVLGAMLEPWPGQSGNYRESVYDHCATDEAKSELYSNIMNKQNSDYNPSALTPQNPFELKEFTPYPVSIDGMDTTSEFTMIVVATGKDSGLVGFRASPAFRVEQDNNLYVDQVSGGNSDSDLLYSGIFTIRFTDFPCYQISDGKGVRIDACKYSTLHPGDHLASNNGTTCINYTSDVISFSQSGIDLDDPRPEQSTNQHGSPLPRQVRFKFTQVSPNAQIYFTNLCGTNGEIKAGRRDLTATLRAPTVPGGQWSLEFTEGWKI